MSINKRQGVAATEALNTFFSRILAISFPSTENFISRQFPLIIHKLRYFEGFILIEANRKHQLFHV